MVNRILLIGQCTLHWGRMEFGNIGNYYIIEPFVRELHRVFPGAEIRTTFQMSADFRRRERVTVLPMSLYYGWTEDDLPSAQAELEAARRFRATGAPPAPTPFISEVRSADLVIDFSGDIWGDNASLVGPDRFLAGLCKSRTAQLLGKPVVMLAGSPGPFDTAPNLDFAREVFANYTWVTNREPVSTELLRGQGFDLKRVETLACPAFLFESAPAAEGRELLAAAGIVRRDRPLIGLVVCGWNFAQGPFSRWPRGAEEYEPFAAAAEFAAGTCGADVCLLSHANAFPPPPAPFELRHGRDFAVVEQLHAILSQRRVPSCFLLGGVYSAQQTKAIIGQFDLLISGRVHAAVAGLSQHVPTVIIDYGHAPKAHKLQGFARVAGVEACVAEPTSAALTERIGWAWANRGLLRAQLETQIPRVQEQARQNFDRLPAAIGLAGP